MVITQETARTAPEARSLPGPAEDVMEANMQSEIVGVAEPIAKAVIYEVIQIVEN